MTDKVLSQDEVDALLKGVAAGDIDTEEKAKEEAPGGVQLYDFASQERIIRAKMPGLEKINDAFARLFRNALTSLVMKYIDISIENVEIVKYGDFIKTIPLPSSINIFSMEPLQGYSLLVFEAPVVFAFIEYFFGGTSAQSVKTEGRSFTPIEQRIIRRVVDAALNDIETSWGVLLPIKAEYINAEINPQFVSIVTPGEIVINIEFNLEIEDFSGKMFLCIPYSMIEPIREKLYAGIHGDRYETDNRWAVTMRETLQEAEMDVTAEIGSLTITFNDLMNFEVGDVVNFNKSVTDEFLVRVEDVPKYTAVPGHHKGNQAIKITGFIEEPV